MRNLIILTITLFCAQQSMAQNPDWNKIREANADKILMSGPRKPTKVLLLGTFHFAYPNLDGHKTDSANFMSENALRFTFVDSMWNAPKANRQRDAYWSRLYKKMYDLGDSLNKELTMLENFLLMAEPITQRRMHGAYTVGGFNTRDNSGPDGLAMWWYSRNLRIFNNILNTSPGGEDRIVVLFGNGHAPILRHCFEASPEFELVELSELLEKR